MKENKFIKRIKKKFLISKYDVEIFDSCITLKNIAIIQKEQPLSSDFVYERLMENSKFLKPLYAEMLMLYRRGDNKSAFNVIKDTVGTKNARNFTSILEKLDLINPGELLEQVIAFQDGMREYRMTKELQKADRNSIITTFCSTLIIFSLLLNFAVVVVFMDTVKILKNFF